MSTVSVIVAAYNQGRYLGDAIRSVLAQTYTDLEVLVVDDGSTDDTRQVAQGFTDPRVRYVYQDNRGLSGARNTGIRLSRGSLLTYLDSDDQFLPDKLSSLIALLDEKPRFGFVAGQAVLIDETGDPLGEVFDRGLPEDSSEWLLGNPLHVGSVLIRREWQERVGLFDEGLRSYEDWDMWLRLARAGCPMGWLARPVSLYRFHRAQMTRIGTQMTAATFAVLEKTYREPGLPETWEARRHQAYSRGFLRAAAQAYGAGDYPCASNHMREAVRLEPALCANAAEPLSRLVAAWANHVKTHDPLAFLSGLYENLPDELSALRARRRLDLGREALQLALAAFRRGEKVAAGRLVRRAARYRPGLLLHRGVASMLLRTTLPGLARQTPPARSPAGWTGRVVRTRTGENP